MVLGWMSKSGRFSLICRFQKLYEHVIMRMSTLIEISMRNISFIIISFCIVALLASITDAQTIINKELSTPFSAAQRTLSVGKTGSDVSSLQQFLKDKGFFKYPKITGYFGLGTRNALISFQSAYKLPKDGIFGPRTKIKMAQLAGVASPIATNLHRDFDWTAGSAGGDPATSITDTTAPVRSSASPSGTLALGTTSTTISLTTNEPATCKYSTSSGTAFGSMTAFSTTGGTTHSAAVSGLINGGSFVYYTKCQDLLVNTNTTDFTISFTVAADITSPTVNVTAPGNNTIVAGSSVAITATASDDVSVAGVQFKLDSSTNIGSEDTVSPYSVTWNSTGVSDGSHTITAVARDGSSNSTTSSVINVTVDNTGPVVSAISSGTPATTTATITWTTNENSNSRVEYGPTISYGSTTTLNPALVASHSAGLSGLMPLTTYHYRVISIDASSNSTTSADQTFTTASDYLLDQVGTSLFAYSNRKLRNGYGGSATEIRRSSDSTTQNIGFSGEDYDTGAFSTFVGGGTGSVRTWYDQSGNGVNASQTTAGSQLNVELNQVNGKPTLLGATGKDMSFTTQTLGTTYDIFGVFNLNGINNSFVLGGKTGGTWNDMLYTSATTVSHGRASANGSIAYAIPKSSWLLAHLKRVDEEWVSLTVNGVVIDWINITNNSPITLDRLVSENTAFNVASKLAEQVYYVRGLNQSEVQAVTSDIASYYGINASTPYVTSYQIDRLSSNTEFAPMDGVALVSFEGNLRLLGGWNTALFPATNGSVNTDWQSSDGITWTQNSNAPWSERHHFGHGVKDSKIWVWGGDISTGTIPKDVWTYTTAGGWVQRTSDWGSAGGSRALFGWTIHEGSLYMAGGQSSMVTGSPVMLSDIVRFNEETNQFEKMGDLPLPYFSAGVLHSYNGDLYIMGGGRYLPGGSDNLNNKVFKSTDDGASWTEIATLPTMMKSMYPNGAVFGGRMWYLLGSNDSSGSMANRAGLYSSTDGINWYIEQYPSARHATGITVHGSALHIVGGNLWDDSWKVLAR